MKNLHVYIRFPANCPLFFKDFHITNIVSTQSF